MPRDRRAETGALRLRLLAGAAAMAMAAGSGAALAQQTPAAPAPAPQRGPDGLTPDAVYLEADTATREGDVISASPSLSRSKSPKLRS